MVAVMNKDITEQTGSSVIEKIWGRDEPEYSRAIQLKDKQLFKFEENVNVEQAIISADKMYIGHLSRQGYCFSPDEKTENIYEIMKINPSITEFTVVENDIAVGFMTRTALNETLGGRYGFTLFSKNPIRDIMHTDFFKVNYCKSVDYVSRLAMQRPFEQLYNPIVVEQEGKYSGIVTVKDLLDTCTKIAQAERDEITVMKDSLKIGLFFMDKNFIIQPQYSRYLEEMLSEEELFGKSFIDLLSTSFNEKELGNIQDYFNMVFNRTLDQEMLNNINPLAEFNYANAETKNQKVFQCEFTIIKQAREEEFILVTMYDITAETELQRRLAEEEGRRQEEMKSVFELIQVEPRVFDDFLEDAEYEFDNINDILRNDKLSAHEALVEIYQSIHAIKSNAVILGLNTFGDKAHNLESKIKKLREYKEPPFSDMLNLNMDIDKLSREKDGFKTTIEKLNSFKNGQSSKKHGQSRYVLVESLTKTINKISKDTEKKIKFIVDEIDDEALDKGPRRIIKETLLQLARNSVVHGIEMPKDRVENGKKETGVIRLSIKISSGQIHIKLADDGCGINCQKIAEKALRLNLIKLKDANEKKLLLKLIFSAGFSTAENEGIHAGRGIGLSLVHDRVRSAKGKIKVQTKTGKGTIFHILLPVIN